MISIERVMSDLKMFLNQLAPVSENSWDKISVVFTPRRLKKGDYFITSGQTAKEIAFLESGIVRGFYQNDKGDEYNKHFFVNPSFVGGYASLVTQASSQIYQQALTECNLLVANYADIQNLFDSCPDIERLARIMAELYFVQKEQREIEIVLLDAAERYQIFLEQFPNLEQQIAQYHIASYLGITPTQLSRIRKKIG